MFYWGLHLSVSFLMTEWQCILTVLFLHGCTGSFLLLTASSRCSESRARSEVAKHGLLTPVPPLQSRALGPWGLVASTRAQQASSEHRLGGCDAQALFFQNMRDLLHSGIALASLCQQVDSLHHLGPPREFWQHVFNVSVHRFHCSDVE